jgi:hypothetical protein
MLTVNDPTIALAQLRHPGLRRVTTLFGEMAISGP